MSKPFILENAIDNWPAAKWTLSTLSALLGPNRLSTRFGPKNHERGTILWEKDCPQAEISIVDLLKWINGEKPDSIPFDKNQYWAYADYKYMFELFDKETLAHVDWSEILDIDWDGTDSTIWIGTSGAYTPCHYDTYGFNLHAQISGHKRWILFPPEDSHLLKPTRIPFEETTVYSSMDVLGDITSLHGCSPYVATLSPGQVLYVPPLWWHSVQCMDECISINCWMPTVQDEKRRENESLTCALASILSNASLIDAPKQSESVTICKELLFNQRVEEPAAKKERMDYSLMFLSKWKERGVDVGGMGLGEVEKLVQQGPLVIEGSKGTERGEGYEQSIVNSLLHPKVIEALKEVLMQ